MLNFSFRLHFDVSFFIVFGLMLMVNWVVDLMLILFGWMLTIVNLTFYTYWPDVYFLHFLAWSWCWIWLVILYNLKLPFGLMLMLNWLLCFNIFLPDVADLTFYAFWPNVNADLTFYIFWRMLMLILFSLMLMLTFFYTFWPNVDVGTFWPDVVANWTFYAFGRMLMQNWHFIPYGLCWR